jgi:hypothetical protein
MLQVQEPAGARSQHGDRPGLLFRNSSFVEEGAAFCWRQSLEALTYNLPLESYTPANESSWPDPRAVDPLRVGEEGGHARRRRPGRETPPVSNLLM